MRCKVRRVQSPFKCDGHEAFQTRAELQSRTEKLLAKQEFCKAAPMSTGEQARE